MIRIIIEFLRGLWVTICHFFKPVVTLQYPKQRWQMPDRYRGVLSLKLDEEGKERCAGCCLCAFYCPASAIKIETDCAEDLITKEVKTFEVNIARCIFCGLCVEVCPKNALEHTKAYELAAYSREELIYEKERLYKGPIITPYKK